LIRQSSPLTGSEENRNESECLVEARHLTIERQRNPSERFAGDLMYPDAKEHQVLLSKLPYMLKNESHTGALGQKKLICSDLRHVPPQYMPDIAELTCHPPELTCSTRSPHLDDIHTGTNCILLDFERLHRSELTMHSTFALFLRSRNHSCALLCIRFCGCRKARSHHIQKNGKIETGQREGRRMVFACNLLASCSSHSFKQILSSVRTTCIGIYRCRKKDAMSATEERRGKVYAYVSHSRKRMNVHRTSSCQKHARDFAIAHTPSFAISCCNMV